MKKATRSILSTVLAVSMAAAACPVSFAATTSNEVTAREKANAALAREAAAQGMVLLENKNNSLSSDQDKEAGIVRRRSCTYCPRWYRFR